MVLQTVLGMGTGMNVAAHLVSFIGTLFGAPPASRAAAPRPCLCLWFMRCGLLLFVVFTSLFDAMLYHLCVY